MIVVEQATEFLCLHNFTSLPQPFIRKRDDIIEPLVVALGMVMVEVLSNDMAQGLHDWRDVQMVSRPSALPATAWRSGPAIANGILYPSMASSRAFTDLHTMSSVSWKCWPLSSPSSRYTPTALIGPSAYSDSNSDRASLSKRFFHFGTQG